MKFSIVMLILFVACGLVRAPGGNEDTAESEGQAAATALAAPDTTSAEQDDAQQTTTATMSDIVTDTTIMKVSAQRITQMQPVATLQETAAQNIDTIQSVTPDALENSETTLTTLSEITTQSNSPIETALPSPPVYFNEPTTRETEPPSYFNEPTTRETEPPIYFNEPTTRETEPSPGTTELVYGTVQEPIDRAVTVHDPQEDIQDTKQETTTKSELAVTNETEGNERGTLPKTTTMKTEPSTTNFTEEPETLSKSQLTTTSVAEELVTLSPTTEAPTTATDAEDIKVATHEITTVTPGPSRGGTATSTAASSRAACNATTDCPNDEICTVREGSSCECASDTSDDSDITLCHAAGAAGNVAVETVATEAAPDRVVAHTWPTQETFRIWSNLTVVDRSSSVTSLKFCAKVEIVEWFQRYDVQFRTFVASGFTHIGYSSKNGSRLNFTAQHIMYVAPSPLQDEGMTLLSIVVQCPSHNTGDYFLSYTQVLAFLKEIQATLEVELQLKVCLIMPGFPSNLLLDKPTNGDSDSPLLHGLTLSGAKILLTVLLIVFACAILVAVVSAVLQRRRSRSVVFKHQVNMPYRFPRAVFRSPGDGHNLASDEMCQQDEDIGQQRTPATVENGACSLMDDANVWVVPYEEFEQTDGGGDGGGGGVDGAATQHPDDSPTSVGDTKF